jgi:hypothetical protein
LRGRLLRGRLRTLHNVAEIGVNLTCRATGTRMTRRHRTGWHFTGGRMLNRSTRRDTFNNSPFTAALFHGVGEVHRATGTIATLGANLHLRRGLISVDGVLRDIHFHVRHIQALHGGQVLHHSGADGFFFIRLRFAGAGEQQGYAKKTREYCSIHADSLPVRLPKVYELVYSIVANHSGNAMHRHADCYKGQER